jgi:hypothetical protein
VRDGWNRSGPRKPDLPPRDAEANRFSARAARYARVGANVGGVAARIAATRILGLQGTGAAELAAA